MNKKQKSLTNKGFSLVELIIVIAIMAVLVGVLAPQFIKYVEQSRKSTDIQNAENIKTAILADIADGKITGKKTKVTFGNLADPFVDGGTMATSITTAPTVQGSVGGKKAKGFYVTYDATAGTCTVSVDSDATPAVNYVLTEATSADQYKNAK